MGTNGVGEQPQPLISYLPSNSVIICLCEMDSFFAFLYIPLHLHAKYMVQFLQITTVKNSQNRIN